VFFNEIVLISLFRFLAVVNVGPRRDGPNKQKTKGANANLL
jgi:hypothetical protein